MIAEIEELERRHGVSPETMELRKRYIPDLNPDDKRFDEIIDLSRKHGTSLTLAARRHSMIDDLFSREAYEQQSLMRQQEKEDAGAKGKVMEFMDSTARGTSRVASAWENIKSALISQSMSPMPSNTELMTSLPVEESSKMKSARNELSKKYQKQAEIYWNVAKNPALAAQDKGWSNKAINMIGETLPYITATTAASMVAGPAGGFAVGASVEGNSAYMTAIESGVDTEKAKLIGVGVGVVSGAIESVGGSQVEKLMNRASAKIKNKVLQKGTEFGIATIVEALEEGSQEIAQITGESTYREIDWNEKSTRIMGSMAGGAFLGGAMRGANIAGNRIIYGKESAIAEEIQNRTGLPREDSEATVQGIIEQQAETDKIEQVSEQVTTSPKSETPAAITPEEVVTAENRKLPQTVQRIEEGGGKPDINKPQGLYTTPSNVLSPHEVVGGEKTEYTINQNSNILDLGVTSDSAGISALKNFGLDKEFGGITKVKERYTTNLSNEELINTLSQKYPDVDWKKYFDQHEMLEGYAGLVARERGYDALWSRDDLSETFDEFVILSENAIQPTPQAQTQTIKESLTVEKKAEEQAQKIETKKQPKPLNLEKMVDEELPPARGARNADVEKERRIFGMDEIASPTRKSNKTSFDNAIKKGIPEKSRNIASDILAKKRLLTDEDEAGMRIQLSRLENESQTVITKIDNANDPQEIQQLASEKAHIYEEMDLISEALKKGGTEVARALQIRQALLELEKDTYSLSYMRAEVKAVKGDNLNETESKKIDELSSKMRGLEAKIAEQQALISELQAKAVLKKRGYSKYGEITKEQLNIEKTKTIENIRDLIKQGCY